MAEKRAPNVQWHALVCVFPNIMLHDSREPVKMVLGLSSSAQNPNLVPLFIELVPR